MELANSASRNPRADDLSRKCFFLKKNPGKLFVLLPRVLHVDTLNLL